MSVKLWALHRLTQVREDASKGSFVAPSCKEQGTFEEVLVGGDSRSFSRPSPKEEDNKSTEKRMERT